MSAREQALAIGRLLFSQEVEIIVLSRYYKSKIESSGGYKYVAVFVPKKCSLNSLLQSDTSEILFETQQPSSSRNSAIYDLLEIMEKTMGAILPVPDADGSNWIDKSLIPDIYKPAIPADTQPAESSTAASYTLKTSGEGISGSDGAVELGEEKILRVTKYTPSGEPYTGLESPNTGNSFLSLQDLTTDPDPDPDLVLGGTMVAGDSGTTIPHFGDGTPLTEKEKIENGYTGITQLEEKLQDVRKAMGGLERKLLDAESLCKTYKKQIEDYKAEIKQSKIIIESQSNEITSLKESVRAAQEAQVIEKRKREEELGQVVAALTKNFLK